jgi:hypothetical protein
MRHKLRSMAAVAAVAALSLGGLSIATAGSAGAQPLGHPKNHKPKPPPQVTGSRLKSALLPAAAFGDGFTGANAISTGGRLLSSNARYHVPGMSCSNFEDFAILGGYGDTAGALADDVNSNPWGSFPNTVLYGIEWVNQFASTQAATTFFNQADAKYGACTSFTEPNPGDTSPGGGTLQVTNMSVSKTTVSGNHAFTVTQQSALSEAPGFSLYNNVLVVVSGTNVYQFWDLSGTNDEPSPALMAQFIKQTQKLYPRR